MNVLKIQYLKMDDSDIDMDKIKLSIPIANELTKVYKSEVVRRQTLLGKYLVTDFVAVQSISKSSFLLSTFLRSQPVIASSRIIFISILVIQRII